MSWGVLAIMCIAAFILVFDTTAMTVAISDLVKDLKFAKTYGWFYAKQPPVSGGIEIAPFGLSITPILLLAGIILFACFRLFTTFFAIARVGIFAGFLNKLMERRVKRSERRLEKRKSEKK